MFEGMEYTETGEYMLSYQSIHGCDSLIFLDLTVSALPEVDLGEDLIICDTIEFYLTAEAGFVNYEWSTGDDGQSILIQTTDEYALWVTDEMGCTGSDTIYIDCWGFCGIQYKRLRGEGGT